MRLLIAALVWTSCVCAQRFSWQDACFKNPRLPYCMGHDAAVRPSPPEKDNGPQRIVKNPGSILSAPGRGRGSPSVIDVGGIDWRFADPFADALAGFNLTRLAGSPAAIRVISQLGAKQDLSQAEMERIFEGLSGVNEMAISIRDDRTVVMITGRVADSAISDLPPGWKAAPVPGRGILFGVPAAVDLAVQRIATQAPLLDTGRFAEQQQNESEIWAIRSNRLLGQQAMRAGVKQFSLAVSIQDRLLSDQAWELNHAPEAGAWPANITGAVIEGNLVHVRGAMAIDDVQEKFGVIAATSLAQDLGTLVKLARYFPAPTPVTHTKPVIDGLDDGPKEVRQ